MKGFLSSGGYVLWRLRRWRLQFLRLSLPPNADLATVIPIQYHNMTFCLPYLHKPFELLFVVSGISPENIETD